MILYTQELLLCTVNCILTVTSVILTYLSAVVYISGMK